MATIISNAAATHAAGAHTASIFCSCGLELRAAFAAHEEGEAAHARAHAAFDAHVPDCDWTHGPGPRDTPTGTTPRHDGIVTEV